MLTHGEEFPLAEVVTNDFQPPMSISTLAGEGGGCPGVSSTPSTKMTAPPSSHRLRIKIIKSIKADLFIQLVLIYKKILSIKFRFL
jgi:hypothetical protein